MRKIILSALIFVMSYGLVPAKDIYPMSAGLSFSWKAGVSAVNPTKGRKNGVAFNKLPDFGGAFYLPMSTTSNLAFCMDLGLANYSYLMKDGHDNSTLEYQVNHSYFALSPSFYFEGFTTGFLFGIPLASDYDGSEIKTANQNIIAEIKIGYSVPLMNDETGRLNFFIQGGYMLTGIYNDFGKNDPFKNIFPAENVSQVTSEFNPRAASLSMGLSFVFNLTDSKPLPE